VLSFTGGGPAGGKILRGGILREGKDSLDGAFGEIFTACLGSEAHGLESRTQHVKLRMVDQPA